MKTNRLFVVGLMTVFLFGSFAQAQNEPAKQADEKKTSQRAKWFESLDKNSDGRISKSEAGDFPRFEKLDFNSNGFITVREATRYAQQIRERNQLNQEVSQDPVFPASPQAVAAKKKLLEPIANVAEKDNRPPNIVLILSDDLGYSDIGLYGSKTIPTPHIDALGSAGVRFSNAYVTAASCSPSRAGLLSGRYQQRFGFEFNTAGGAITHRLQRGLDPAAVTLSDVMKQAGYATGMFGKWHLGTQPHLHPQARGFDQFYGFLAGAHSFFPAKSKEPVHSTIMRGHDALIESEYLTDAIARETVQFINAQQDKPFFAYVPFNAVHTPIEATRKYQDRFPGVENKTKRDYYAMTSALDDAVGAIVKAIDDNGLTDNTVVIFLNDNGGPIYNGVQSNEPLKLGKLFLFEGGIRVPMVIKWPGVATPDSVFDGTTSSLDVFPTACSAAGIKLPEGIQIDGVDLTPFIKNQTGQPHETLFWSNGPNFAVRHGDWKLVKSYDNVWLYDLSQDIGEKSNLAASRPDIVKQLEEAYKKWRTEMSEPRWPSKTRRRKVEVDGMVYEMNI